MPVGVYDSFDHNIHHYYGQCNYNYGLFFQFWDRMMGTYKGGVAGNLKLSGTEKVEKEEMKDEMKKDERGLWGTVHHKISR